MSNPYASIPEPQGSVESLVEAVRALKINVEMLTGQRPIGAAARVFVQDAVPSAMRAGDLWITTGASLVRYWNGTEWLKLTIV